MPVSRVIVILFVLVPAAPAWATDSTAIPEGSHLTLFALGVLGVLIGRRASIIVQRRARARERDAD